MKCIDEVSVGENIVHKIVITEEMHNNFSDLSGDDSPIHSDSEFAKMNGYKGRIGYAFLITTILSKIYGTIFPGGSELCLKQECNFPHPYYIDDELIFKIEVIHKNEDLRLMTVMTNVENQEQKNVFRGKGVFQLSLGKSI